MATATLSQEEIHSRRVKLEGFKGRVKQRTENIIKAVDQKLEDLQKECTHPNATRLYGDYICESCPDCGNEDWF